MKTTTIILPNENLDEEINKKEQENNIVSRNLIDIEEERREFWEGFISKAKELEFDLFSNKKITHISCLTTKIVSYSCILKAIINRNKTKLQINIDWQISKDILIFKNEITAKIPKLSWKAWGDSGTQIIKLLIRESEGLDHRLEWNEIYEEMISNLKTLYETFFPYLEKILSDKR